VKYAEARIEGQAGRHIFLLMHSFYAKNALKTKYFFFNSRPMDTLLELLFLTVYN
jgi:hypothetical protein